MPWLLALLLLAGCAAQPVREPAAELPTLNLTPASLGRELAWQQRLEITVGERSQTLEALLEIDPRQLQLGVQALGQSALTLRWDGKDLQQTRADWLPPGLDGARVLFDLQLMLWPVEQIRAALPKDWQLLDAGGQRRLLYRDVEILSVDYPSDRRVVLVHARDHYRLDVSSVPVAEGTP